MKCLFPGSSVDLFLSSKTSILRSLRCSSDRSGLMNTCLYCTEFQRSLDLAKICRTTVVLETDTLTGRICCLASLDFFRPSRVASNLGFSPSSIKTLLIFSQVCSSESEPVSSGSPKIIKFRLRSSSATTSLNTFFKVLGSKFNDPSAEALDFCTAVSLAVRL